MKDTRPSLSLPSPGFQGSLPSRAVLGATLALALLVSSFSSTAAAEAKFVPIFDGKSLVGWAGHEDLWRVQDGVIIGETTAAGQIAHNTFLIWEKEEVADFEIRFRYRIGTESANSGIQIRSRWLKDVGDGFVLAGFQPDIATVVWITGIHFEERGRGILARRGQRTVIGEDGERDTTRFAEEAELGQAFEHSEWNDYHVVVRGDTIIARINGQKMHEVVDRSPEAQASGYIGFQIHSGAPMRIEFKDIELMRFNP